MGDQQSALWEMRKWRRKIQCQYCMSLPLIVTVIFVVRDDGTTRSTHKKPKEDTFGQNDEDWMVYRSIVSLEFV